MTIEPAQSLTTKKKVYRDDLGRVFDRMHVQYGTSFDFPVGIKRDDAEDFAWEWFSHVEYDGIGVMEVLARRQGAELRLPQLKIRPDRHATVFDHIRPLLRRSYLRAAPRSPWDRPAKVPPPSTERHIPQHVIELSESETRAVGEVARGLGVSINSLVLWSLAEAVRSFATKPSHRQHWTVPVNMRGGAGISPTAANPLSFIRVPIRPRDSVQHVHALLYDLLETGMHWVMLRWITFFANRARTKFPPVRSTGCFSNVGVHHAPGIARVAICPPLGPTEPIAGCIVTWNGVMSLALSVHHTMNPPPGQIDAVADRWRSLILSGRVA